jgi:hypothetical protein
LASIDQNLGEGIGDIIDDDALTFYALINNNGEITKLLAEKSDVGFTIDDYISHYKSKCVTYDYKTIARDPDKYRGENAKFTGKVIQVMESGNSIMLRVNVTRGSYSVYRYRVCDLYS